MDKPTHLFRFGDFLNRAGHDTHFLVHSSVLMDEDFAALAAYVAPQLQPFSSVYGIPRTGTRFAEALRQHVTPDAGGRLIADDVVYTNDRFHDIWQPGDSGVAIFNRSGQPLPGIFSIFTINEALR